MLKEKRVAILATDGYEQSELTRPLEALRHAGADVKVVSLDAEPIRGVRGKDWVDRVDVDTTVDQVTAEDFDALVLPGGLYNPDRLRTYDQAVGFVRSMFDAKKPIGAICHGPWLLIEANVVYGRRATSITPSRTTCTTPGRPGSTRKWSCTTAW